MKLLPLSGSVLVSVPTVSALAVAVFSATALADRATLVGASPTERKTFMDTLVQLDV